MGLRMWHRRERIGFKTGRDLFEGEIVEKSDCTGDGTARRSRAVIVMSVERSAEEVSLLAESHILELVNRHDHFVGLCTAEVYAVMLGQCPGHQVGWRRIDSDLRK